MSKLKDLEEQCKEIIEEIEKLKKEEVNELYNIVKFSNHDWYIIDEDDDTLTLFLKDKLSPEQCIKYFDKRLLDCDKDVRFNPNYKNIWWADSPIRMTLNSEFLKELDILKMELMTTTVSADGQSRTTEDYVRLLTKDEAERLPQDILKSNYEYGYWTMSPSHFSNWGDSYAFEFLVFLAGELTGTGVGNGYGVRPVIRVTKDNSTV
jgi:hypothetical protein|nr:MAG TPA: hypothetical protein [Caudoviricetes sp.]